MARQITPESTLTGTWHVDPAAGKVGFTVRTMWGLAKVRGSFSRYRGTLTEQALGMIRGDAHLEVDLELVRG